MSDWKSGSDYIQLHSFRKVQRFFFLQTRATDITAANIWHQWLYLMHPDIATHAPQLLLILVAFSELNLTVYIWLKNCLLSTYPLHQIMIRGELHYWGFLDIYFPTSIFFRSVRSNLGITLIFFEKLENYCIYVHPWLTKMLHLAYYWPFLQSSIFTL